MTVKWSISDYRFNKYIILQGGISKLLLYKFWFCCTLLHLGPEKLFLTWCVQCFHHRTGWKVSMLLIRAGGQTEQPSQPRVTPHISALFSAGEHAAVDSDASAKCCHPGSGPPDRYKIASRSYRRRVPQRWSNYIRVHIWTLCAAH